MKTKEIVNERKKQVEKKEKEYGRSRELRKEEKKECKSERKSEHKGKNGK